MLYRLSGTLQGCQKTLRDVIPALDSAPPFG